MQPWAQERIHSHAVAWAIGAALVILTVHALVSVLIDLNAYADGAWFDFALRVGKPFQLVWRNYPTRITPYLLEFASAYGLMRAHVPADMALGAGHAVWCLAPVASLYACWKIAPAGKRIAALPPAAYFVFFGLLTWGFPTEIWLVAVFAWPAALLLLYGANTTANGLTVGALVIAMLFSHEAALVLVPLFLLAGWTRRYCRPPRIAFASVLSVAVGLALWLLVRQLVRPDPVIAMSVGFNARHFFGLAALTGHPALAKYAIIACAAVVLANLAVSWPRLRLLALGVLLIWGLLIGLQDAGLAGAARYQVRSVCLLALGGLILLSVAHRRWGLPRFLVVHARIWVLFAALAAGLMAAVVIDQNTRFALAWRRYDQALSAVVNRPGGETDLPPSLAASPAAWAWGAPFRSILLAHDPQSATVVRDNPTAGEPIRSGLRIRLLTGACAVARLGLDRSMDCSVKPAPAPPAARFMPLSCIDAQALTLDGGRPANLQVLTRMVCGPQDLPTASHNLPATPFPTRPLTVYAARKTETPHGDSRRADLR
jgi:hypothetical protein